MKILFYYFGDVRSFYLLYVSVYVGLYQCVFFYVRIFHELIVCIPHFFLVGTHFLALHSILFSFLSEEIPKILSSSIMFISFQNLQIKLKDMTQYLHSGRVLLHVRNFEVPTSHVRSPCVRVFLCACVCTLAHTCVYFTFFISFLFYFFSLCAYYPERIVCAPQFYLVSANFSLALHKLCVLINNRNLILKAINRRLHSGRVLLLYVLSMHHLPVHILCAY